LPAPLTAKIKQTTCPPPQFFPPTLLPFFFFPRIHSNLCGLFKSLFSCILIGVCVPFPHRFSRGLVAVVYPFRLVNRLFHSAFMCFQRCPDDVLPGTFNVTETAFSFSPVFSAFPAPGPSFFRLPLLSENDGKFRGCCLFFRSVFASTGIFSFLISMIFAHCGKAVSHESPLAIGPI